METTNMLINVILDRSGSMSGLVPAVLEHFNNYKEEVSNIPNVRMSIFQFDDQYETLYLNQPIEAIPDLTTEKYYARGNTALLDAIGRTIRTIDSLEVKPEKIIVVINTDGFENSSHEYNGAQIKEMVTERQNNHGWQFVFVGAGIDAFTMGTLVGVRGSSTWSSWNNTSGYSDSYRVLTGATAAYASGTTATVNMAQSGIDLNITQATEPPKDDIDSKVNGEAGMIEDRLKRKKAKIGSSTR